MTRPSKRELESTLDDLEAETPPEEPPAFWMEFVPRELWSDTVESWRYYIELGHDRDLDELE